MRSESEIVKKKEDLKYLSDWMEFGIHSTKLLFRGTRDGFTADAFHSLCDNRGPTLVLVKS